MLGYATKKDVCHATGISNTNMYCYLANGIIPAPTHEIGKKKYYTVSEAEKVVEQIKKHREEK